MRPNLANPATGASDLRGKGRSGLGAGQARGSQETSHPAPIGRELGRHQGLHATGPPSHLGPATYSG
eukprot:4634560-Prorocentrum_lima.AAC.1